MRVTPAARRVPAGEEEVEVEDEVERIGVSITEISRHPLDRAAEGAAPVVRVDDARRLPKIRGERPDLVEPARARPHAGDAVAHVADGVRAVAAGDAPFHAHIYYTDADLSAARALVRDGARVLVTSRSESNVAAALATLGPSACGFAADGASKTEELRGFSLAEVRYRRPLP